MVAACVRIRTWNSFKHSMAHARRGTRVPVHISLSVTSLNAAEWFCEPVLIILANQHGCAARIRRQVSLGTRVILDGLPSSRKMAAGRVVTCICLGEYENFWLVGIELDEPGNVWGIDTPPDDWVPCEQAMSLVDRVLSVWQSVSSKKKTDDQVLH